MKCRPNCGACCIAPSISSPIPGMPDGKPAGVRCIHLTEDYRCSIYDRRPKVCRDFQAEELVCGRSREEAMKILSDLESGVGNRKSEVGSQKSEVGSWKSESRSRKSEVGKQKSEICNKTKKQEPKSSVENPA